MGCSQHDFTHDGQKYIVDECVCDTALCNKDMQPIPETTTKLTPETTTKGEKITFDIQTCIYNSFSP